MLPVVFFPRILWFQKGLRLQNIILIFVHMMSAAVACGSMMFFILLLLPVFRKNEAPDIAPEESITIKVMDRLASLVMGCVFTLVITGVYYLLVNYTDQVNLKPGYYNIFGMKMLFAIGAMGLSVYQTFALRPRISDLDLSPEDKKNVPKTLKSMLTVSQVNLWVISIAAFFGIFLNRF